MNKLNERIFKLQTADEYSPCQELINLQVSIKEENHSGCLFPIELNRHHALGCEQKQFFQPFTYSPPPLDETKFFVRFDF